MGYSPWGLESDSTEWLIPSVRSEEPRCSLCLAAREAPVHFDAWWHQLSFQLVSGESPFSHSPRLDFILLLLSLASWTFCLHCITPFGRKWLLVRNVCPSVTSSQLVELVETCPHVDSVQKSMMVIMAVPPLPESSWGNLLWGQGSELPEPRTLGWVVSGGKAQLSEEVGEAIVLLVANKSLSNQSSHIQWE